MTRGFWVGRPLVLYAGALFLAASVAVSACYTGDQSCAEAYNLNDPNDHCPYGPPGGPKLNDDTTPACPEVAQINPADPSCLNAAGKKLSFVADVYPRMEAADGGNCSSGGTGCHTSTIKGITPFEDPTTMLDALAVYKGEVGRKYYDPEAPKKSWWICNLRGDTGKLMPTGGTPRMKAEDILLTERWLACGATISPPAANVLSGSGGSGGVGGEAGSGGSGGEAGGP